MTRESLKSILEYIYVYFKRKDQPTSQMIDMWTEDLDRIPDTNVVIDGIKNRFKENDGIPVNIPKAVRIAYYSWLRENKTQDEVEYNQYEDSRYPVQNLYKAAETLSKYGMGQFLNFCDRTGMPFCDKNRAIQKCIRAHNITELSEIPCPNFLKDERLRVYTDFYRYSQKDALSFFSRMEGGTP